MSSAVEICGAFTANGTVGESDCRTLLRAAGIKTVKGRLAEDADAAVAIAGEIGYPVALKVDSADIPHKSEIGGVVLNLTSEAELRQACAEVLASSAKHAPDAAIAGFGVYEMVQGAVELIAGMCRDPIFGPVLLLGMGGVFAETLDDKVLRVTPLAEGEAGTMARQLKGFALLDSARGQPAADTDALAEIMARLAALALACPDIDEIDINPLMLLPRGQGALAADALVILRGNGA